MLAAAKDPQQLARRVGERVECDYDSMVVGATRLVAEAGGAAPEGGVYFSGKIVVAAGAFVLGKVINFGSLDYVGDCYGELHPLKETALVGADLEVLARQIWLGLGPNPTVLEQHQIFYMLANVHYQIITGEVVSPPDRLWYYLHDLVYGIQNAAMSFQLKLEHLVC